ncbi:threonine-phosphate decarboxylase CobD [Nitratireductor pacificus]|uniref:threonine-phosphate decarboxylase n=1 Tax=Nitratireductor pacificus pht-3B TaxID=391937 RepID=K2MB27_9HYPH|nr:threonine-phosphate decarboxylase CobD [Nitratireductor pacificus]EKF19366.1 L-threonine-O-3-phosphate decarboxylase [Nitratireductor pacificus pht-3B]
MDIRPRLSGTAKAVTDHGGSLVRAAALFPGAPTPWLDLSTGINPHSYPFPPLPATAYARLPEEARLAELAALAARVYGAPDGAHLVAAPGTQVLLPLVAALLPAGPAMVLAPTYAEHARAAALAGHAVEEVEDFERLFEARLAVVVNPNNPDGRVIPRDRLLALAAHLHGRGGLLVVDEAFMDVGPRAESVAGDVGAGGLVVLRSFGKFFGLAGVRLGFAAAMPAIAARLSGWLGPWAVAGPALEIGMTALADTAWQETMRKRLAAEAARLDRTLAAQGLAVSGGTDLFRFLRLPAASGLFETLGRHGILVRSFAGRPDCLRLGLPGSDADHARLEHAFQTWRAAGAAGSA